MKSYKLSGGRIVLGVFLSILFFPFVLLLPIIGGNLRIANSKLLNSEVYLQEFENMGGHDKVQEIVLSYVGESAGEEAELIEPVLQEIIDKDFIDDILKQVLDRVFENKKINIDLADELENGIKKAVADIYEDAAETVIDDWINDNTDGEYAMIYEMCDEIISEKMVEYAATQFGIDKSMINVAQVKNYLQANPLSEADKKAIIDECEAIVNDYVDSYAADIAEAANDEIKGIFEELDESEDINMVTEIISILRDYADKVVIACAAILLIMWLLLLLVFKAKRTAFYFPAITVILSAAVFYVEYYVATLVIGNTSEYFSDFDGEIEGFAIEFVMSILGGIKDTFFTSAVAIAIVAAVLVVMGTIIHIIRKSRIKKMA